MSRAPWTIARTLAVSLFLMSGAGCKDSTSSYIGFDAATDTPTADVKADSPVADTGGGDANRSDAAPDSGAADSQSIDAVADAAGDATPTDTVDDAGQGQ